MTAIMAATSLVNASAALIPGEFVYNKTTDDTGLVQTETVYRVEDGKYLKHHLKYEYAYDETGRMVRKEARKWDEASQSYERYYCMDVNYRLTATDVLYAAWDDETGTYSARREKATYQLTPEGVAYQGYEWSEHMQDWNLLLAHNEGSQVELLAQE